MSLQRQSVSASNDIRCTAQIKDLITLCKTTEPCALAMGNSGLGQKFRSGLKEFQELSDALLNFYRVEARKGRVYERKFSDR